MSDRQTSTLYIRGMPEAVARRARAAAALRGVTLSQLVSEALTGYLGIEEPGADPELTPIRADVAWYDLNRASLLESYPGQYLAILDAQVVDHDAEFSPLARRVFARFPDRAVFMPRCQPGEPVVKVRSPRVARR